MEGIRKWFLGARWVCTGNGSGERGVSGATTITCTSNPVFLEPLPSGAGIGARVAEEVEIAVNVENGVMPGTYSNDIMMSGGGASANTVSDPVAVAPGIPGFGVAAWEGWFSNADGTTDTQAGSHPYTATFAVNFNQVASMARPGAKPRAGLRVGLQGTLKLFCRLVSLVIPVRCRSVRGRNWTPSTVPQHHRSARTRSMVAILGTGKVCNMVPPPGVPDEFAISIGGFKGPSTRVCAAATVTGSSSTSLSRT